MEFLCYHRDRPGSRDLRHALVEEHWAYMDQFDATMVARGPTFEGEALTGSLHVLDLPDPAAARAFAFEEPGYQAGAYRDVLLRRWRNDAARTMREHAHRGDDRFLVLAFTSMPADAVPPVAVEPRLITAGPLLSDDGRIAVGYAALVEASDADGARTVLPPCRYDGVEVHHWQPGGRRG